MRDNFRKNGLVYERENIEVRTAPKLSGFVASFCCQFSCLSFWATRILRAFLNSSFPALFKSALRLPLAQNKRHENWKQKYTTNPDNFGQSKLTINRAKWDERNFKSRPLQPLQPLLASDSTWKPILVLLPRMQNPSSLMQFGNSVS